MEGTWQLSYVDYVHGLGPILLRISLVAREEHAAFEEAKESWRKMPKRIVDESALRLRPLRTEYPHSPRLICVCDCVLDLNDKAGEPESQ